MKFFKLTDRENYGTIVRAEGISQQEFDKALGWVESGIMMEYFCDESTYYNSYKEITEEEAILNIQEILM